MRTVTGFERAVSQRIWNGPGLPTFTFSRKLPSARTRVEATYELPRYRCTRASAAAGDIRPAKSIWCRYVVAFGAVRVSAGVEAAAAPGNASTATSRGRARRTTERLAVAR